MPKTDIDVYKEWLGITETARPLNHYQLLRLKQFEDDAGKVRENYRKMNAHVRKYGAGEYGPLSQKLLNELAKAMLCLTDSRRKSEYDVTLGRTAPAKEGVRQTFEQMLLARKVVDSAQLGKARNFASTVHIELKDALVEMRLASADTATQVLAESIGLPFIDLADIEVDDSLATRIPRDFARRLLCVPILTDDRMLLIASCNSTARDIEERLRRMGTTNVAAVLCKSDQVKSLVTRLYAIEGPTGPPQPRKRPTISAMPANPQARRELQAILDAERRPTIRALNVLIALGLLTFACGFLYVTMSDFLQTGAGILPFVAFFSALMFLLTALDKRMEQQCTAKTLRAHCVAAATSLLVVGVITKAWQVPTVVKFASMIRDLSDDEDIEASIGRFSQLSPDATKKSQRIGKMIAIRKGGSKIPDHIIRDGLDPIYFDLPARLRAESPDQVETVVTLTYRTEKVGQYSNNGDAYAIICKVTIIDAQTKAIVAETTVSGGVPFEVTQASAGPFPHYGPSPDKQVLHVLTGLAAGKTIQELDKPR